MIELRLTNTSPEQKIYIHRGERSFELREFKDGTCRLQMYNGSKRTGETVMLNQLYQSTFEALDKIQNIMEMGAKLSVWTVVGEDEHAPGWWIVRRPDGAECGGRWVSKKDAQSFCDKYNGPSFHVESKNTEPDRTGSLE